VAVAPTERARQMLDQHVPDAFFGLVDDAAWSVVILLVRSGGVYPPRRDLPGVPGSPARPSTTCTGHSPGDCHALSPWTRGPQPNGPLRWFPTGGVPARNLYSSAYPVPSGHDAHVQQRPLANGTYNDAAPRTPPAVGLDLTCWGGTCPVHAVSDSCGVRRSCTLGDADPTETRRVRSVALGWGSIDAEPNVEPSAEDPPT
jgi:hypothetical protein